jgi:hypothetical protein
MPKSKKRAKKTDRPTGRAGKSWRGRAIAAVVLGAAIIVAGIAWWRWSNAESTFLALAAEGRAALAQVQSLPSEGRTHLSPGETHRYASRFPTSGPHYAEWSEPGVYETAERPSYLVHALEHGNIVVYVDQPAPAVVGMLEAWASLYGGQWDGIVLVPMSGLGEAVVLTAWTKRLRLDRFDPAAAAAFIDAYRGRGPEHPVR